MKRSGVSRPGKVRIDVLLVERGLCDTRSKARARVLAGEVVVDDHRVDKPGHAVSTDAAVRLKGGIKSDVSRGATKLRGAFEAWPLNVDGAVAIDVGASTGGFTEVLLERGARRVYAVDVGYGQLAWKLRNDPRVVNMERTHIGRMEQGALDPPPSVCVIDVSFIALRKVLAMVAPHLAPAGTLFGLVKPQFEAGREHIGKGGIVTDPEVRQRSVEMVKEAALHLGFTVAGERASPITGTTGNVEFLLHLTWNAPLAAPAPRDDENTGAS